MYIVVCAYELCANCVITIYAEAEITENVESENWNKIYY